ncbi:nucleotide-binding alpha-beta plait domain-containing protein [Tanacetum coccineum]
MMGGVGGGIGVWVGLLASIMVGGDGRLVVCGNGGGCGRWFEVVMGRASGRGGAWNNVKQEGEKFVPAPAINSKKFGKSGVDKSFKGVLMGDKSAATEALGNEGFSELTIKYMGELWVMLEFKSEESVNKFKECTSATSWFSQVIKASTDFEVVGRVAWIEVEGVPFKLWTGKTFSRIANKWGKLLDVDDEEDTCFHSKRICIQMKSSKSINEDFKIIHRDDQKQEDFDENGDGEKGEDNPLEEEELVKSFGDGKYSDKKMERSDNKEDENVVRDEVRSETKVGDIDAHSECHEPKHRKDIGNESSSSGHFKKSEIPRSGGSMIGVLEEVVKGRARSWENKMEGNFFRQRVCTWKKMSLNDEIKKACGMLVTDKLPGPDGLHVRFILTVIGYLVDKEVLKREVPSLSMVSPTTEIQFVKGLKARVIDAGLFHGINIGGSITLSHMFYADDAVFVGEWNDNNITSLIHALGLVP